MFDVVTLHQVLHFAEKPDAAIAEAARVLAPGAGWWLSILPRMIAKNCVKSTRTGALALKIRRSVRGFAHVNLYSTMS